MKRRDVKAQDNKQNVPILHMSRRAQYQKFSISSVAPFSRKAQMKLSFGMIFSIILIIIFIAFAFYAIKNFVNIGKEAQISKFANDLQNDIDRAWKSSKSSQQEIYSLPEKINEICFEDNENENLYFRSSEFIMPQRIEHLNYEKMFLEVETFCIENKDGKVTLIIEKEFGEDEVTIKSE